MRNAGAVPLEDRSDVELLNLYLDGDENGFSELYKRYKPGLLTFCFKLLRAGDQEEVEDIVQMAFMRVAKHARNFHQEKRFSTWIFTITANLCHNHYRNNNRRKNLSYEVLSEGNFPFLSKDKVPDEECHFQLVIEMVNKEVDELPLEHQEVIHLREVEGFKYDEIASMTRVNMGTVKSRLNRARAILSHRLKKRGVYGAN